MSDEKRTFGFKVDREITAEELAEKCDALVEVDCEIRRIKSEKALAMAQFNSDLKDKGKVQEALLGVIKAKTEKVEIDCYEEIDERLGEVTTHRVDNGQIVDRRPLTNDERSETKADPNQGDLFEGKPAGEGDAPADASAADDEDDGGGDPDLENTLNEYAAQQGAEAAAAEGASVAEGTEEAGA